MLKAKPKKATAEKKQAPTKAPAVSKPSPFNIFSKSFQASQSEAHARLEAVRKSKAIPIRKYEEFTKALLPLPHMLLEYLLANRGIPERTLVTVLGKHGTGKSSLAVYVLGYWMRNNIYSGYIETEEKFLTSSRARRIISPDPEEAQRILDIVPMMRVNSHRQFGDAVHDWLQTTRGTNGINKSPVPMTVPIALFCDTTSKLMTEAQSTDILVGYGAAAKKAKDDEKKEKDKKAKDPFAEKKAKKPEFVNAADNKVLDAGRFWAPWVKQATGELTINNAVLWLCSHTDTKIDMQQKYTPFQLPESYKELTSKSFPGSNALMQTSVFVINLFTQAEWAPGKGQEKEGKVVRARCGKSSVSPTSREIEFILRYGGHERYDYEGYQSPVFLFDEAFAELLLEKGVLGLKAKESRGNAPKALGAVEELYISSVLGGDPMTAAELYTRIIGDEDLRNRVGAELLIEGYDRKKAGLLAAAPPEPPPPPPSPEEEIPEAPEEPVEEVSA
jgi:hypothetical protein